MIVPVTDPSLVAEARRTAARAAEAAGFGEEDAGRAALVATELATNLIKHARDGVVAVSSFNDADGAGIEILSLDKGPGMADVQRCLRDGYSTVGSAGTGLGAVQRLAQRFAIWSGAGQGSAIVARLLPGNAPRSTPRRAVAAAVASNAPGERVCGDGWTMVERENGLRIFVGDGSGHGVLAAEAIDVAVKAFHAGQDLAIEHLAERLHRALGATRGAAIALADIDLRLGVVRFLGIGNIAGMMVDSQHSRRMVSHGGTAGHTAPRMRAFEYAFDAAPLVILHSDGISQRWDLAQWPAIAVQHPALIAGTIWRDQQRGRDDATVVAIKTGCA
jgi:anti-sigma regulatory factor (Ser/Thr protein kinase)